MKERLTAFLMLLGVLFLVFAPGAVLSDVFISGKILDFTDKQPLQMTSAGAVVRSLDLTDPAEIST